MNDVFKRDNAKKFILEYLERRGKQINYWNNGLNLRLEEQLDNFRARHTISALLLGIVLRDELSINMKSLPKLYQDDYKKNFLYFWVLTCVFHDLAYVIESRSDEYIDSLKSIEDFVVFFDIRQNMIDNMDNKNDAELIKNYYRYRIEKQRTIDHGITAALLVYNSLMTKYNEAREFGVKDKNRSILFNNLRFSEEFPIHILYISKTIAQHNMWRSRQGDTKIYEKYLLHQLIPNNSKFKKIFIESNEGLLTLLGLVDTIEPIKSFSYMCFSDSYYILNEIKIRFFKWNKSFSITGSLIYGNEKFKKSVSDIEEWLEVSVQTKNDEIRFLIK